MRTNNDIIFLYLYKKVQVQKIRSVLSVLSLDDR